MKGGVLVGEPRKNTDSQTGSTAAEHTVFGAEVANRRAVRLVRGGGVMSNDTPPTPRIQPSPRKEVKLWIPFLRHNREPHGRQITVDWHIVSSIEVDVHYHITDEPYLTGHEYAGIEPIYLKETGDLDGEGVFLLQALCLLFSWIHDERGIWQGKARVVATRKHLTSLWPEANLPARPAPPGTVASVSSLDERRTRRSRPVDPDGGGQ